MAEQVTQFTQDYGCAPIGQVALDLEILVDRTTCPGTFQRLYWRWHFNNTRTSARHFHFFVPRMVRRLRETKDAVEFCMILRFLRDCPETNRLSLAFVLGELSLNENR
jgi:hypothetical protein